MTQLIKKKNAFESECNCQKHLHHFEYNDRMNGWMGWMITTTKKKRQLKNLTDKSSNEEAFIDGSLCELHTAKRSRNATKEQCIHFAKAPMKIFCYKIWFMDRFS